MASQSTRFAVGIHVLALLELCREQRCTSEFIAASVGTNPVVIRRITKLLANAGIIRVHAGVGGAELARPLDRIRLLEVYRAVESGREEGGLFGIHEHPHPRCPVGANIQASLEAVFEDAQRAVEVELRSRTLKDVVSDLERRGRTA